MGVSGSYGVSEYGVDLLPGVGENTVTDSLLPIHRLFYGSSGSRVPGIYLDCSSLSTIYQDAGATAGVVGQAMGTHWDQSLGLAKTLWRSFDFSSSTDWVLGAGWTIAGGKLVATAAATSSVASYNVAYGALYTLLEVTYTISGLTSGGVKAQVNNAGGEGPTRTANGTYTDTLCHLAGTGRVRFVTVGASTTLNIDDVTINIISGYHAGQSNAGLKPLLAQTAGGLYYANCDAVDDVLAVTLPAGMSATSTVAYSRPGTGAEINTVDLSAGGTYNISTDYHALVIWGGDALTASQTAQLTAFLNRRAGV